MVLLFDDLVVFNAKRIEGIQGLQPFADICFSHSNFPSTASTDILLGLYNRVATNL